MSPAQFAPVCLPVIDGRRMHGSGAARGMKTTPLESDEPGTRRNDEDAALMRRLASGDREAFAQLYDRFSRPLFSIALRVLNDPGEAEDVIHDVFVTVWNKAGEFESAKGHAFSWCATLTRNRAIDRVRSRKRRGELLSQSVPADLGYDDTNAGSDSAEHLWLTEKATAVRAALSNLPEEQRAALRLAYFGSLTQQEIATRLGAPLGTIKARIRRGLLRLRELLPHGL